MQVADAIDKSTQYEHAIDWHGRYMVVHGDNDSNRQGFGYDSDALKRREKDVTKTPASNKHLDFPI